MFDPTAYENIKVVLEGLVYDYDLNDEIVVTERNDIVNLADFSRSFSMSFSHKIDKHEQLIGKLELTSSFKQIASEWFPLNEQPGSGLNIQFILSTEMNEVLEKRLIKHFKHMYSSDFDFQWTKLHHSNQTISYEYLLKKYHPITERTIEDLSGIVEKSLKSLYTIYEMT